MPQIQLRIYQNPAEAQVAINIKRKDGGYETEFAKVDTGAAVTLLPMDMMLVVDYRLIREHPIRIQQAGIAQQYFEAFEAIVTLFLEDSLGTATTPREVLVWFAVTRVSLLGFEGLLDRAVLHLDMPNLSGYIEIDE